MKSSAELTLEFTKELSKKFNEGVYANRNGHYYILTLEEGLKFIRIVQQSVFISGGMWTHEFEGKMTFEEFIQREVEMNRMSQRSVHAFVEKRSGRLAKASGWSQPAKLSNGELQSKWNLSDINEFADAVANADFAGGYLYK